MSGTRSQSARWKSIISILKHREKVTADSLAMELEVSARTIHRDLDVLRDDFHAPIEFDSSRRTFFLTEEEWQLRPVQLTESELFHLVIAAGMAGQFHGTPIAKGLSQLFDKLEGVLVEPIDLDPALIADKVSFHGGHPRAISSSVWRTLVGSLRNHQVLRIYYQAAGYPKPTMRESNPCTSHVVWAIGIYSLVALAPQTHAPMPCPGLKAQKPCASSFNRCRRIPINLRAKPSPVLLRTAANPSTSRCVSHLSLRSGSVNASGILSRRSPSIATAA